jgi:hypothetical protein
MKRATCFSLLSPVASFTITIYIGSMLSLFTIFQISTSVHFVLYLEHPLISSFWGPCFWLGGGHLVFYWISYKFIFNSPVKLFLNLIKEWRRWALSSKNTWMEWTTSRPLLEQGRLQQNTRCLSSGNNTVTSCSRSGSQQGHNASSWSNCAVGQIDRNLWVLPSLVITQPLLTFSCLWAGTRSNDPLALLPLWPMHP